MRGAGSVWGEKVWGGVGGVAIVILGLSESGVGREGEGGVSGT